MPATQCISAEQKRCYKTQHCPVFTYAHCPVFLRSGNMPPTGHTLNHSPDTPVSNSYGNKFPDRTEEAFGPGFHHFNIPPESTSSLTALLELPPNQAVELLVHTPPSPPPPPPVPEVYGFSSFSCDVPPPIFPADMELINRAAKFSVLATPEKSPENTPESSDNKQAKESNKRNKKSVDDGKNGGGSGGDEKLPYVHVRARRGQATDSHSLAERARRKKINARMKLLQELVPGCHKYRNFIRVKKNSAVSHKSTCSIYGEVDQLRSKLVTFDKN